MTTAALPQFRSRGIGELLDQAVRLYRQNFLKFVIIPFIAPIVIIERQGPGDAIRRAWDLSRRRFWWILGFISILFIFNFMVIGGPAMLVGYIFQFSMGEGPLNFSASQAIIQTIIQSTLQLVMSLLYFPLQFIAILLLYFDLRIRTEGFDLALLSAGPSGASLQIEEFALGASRPEAGNWFTMREMGYFVLIEFIVAILYFVFVFLIVGLVFGLASASGASGF